MTLPRGYRSYADFQREEIRPEMRIGWSIDDLEHPEHELDFDADPFEAALDEEDADSDED